MAENNPSPALTEQFLARVFQKMGLTSPKITSPEMGATAEGASRLFRGELPGEKPQPPGQMWTNHLPTAIKFSKEVPNGVVSAVDVPDEIYQKSMMRGRADSGRTPVTATPKNPEVREVEGDPEEWGPNNSATKIGFLANKYALNKQQIIPMLIAAGFLDQAGNWTKNATPDLQEKVTNFMHGGSASSQADMQKFDKENPNKASLNQFADEQVAGLPMTLMMGAIGKAGMAGKVGLKALGIGAGGLAGWDIARHSYGGNIDSLSTPDVVSILKQNGVYVDPKTEQESLDYATQQKQGAHFPDMTAGEWLTDLLGLGAGIAGVHGFGKDLAGLRKPVYQAELVPPKPPEAPTIDVPFKASPPQGSPGGAYAPRDLTSGQQGPFTGPQGAAPQDQLGGRTKAFLARLQGSVGQKQIEAPKDGIPMPPVMDDTPFGAMPRQVDDPSKVTGTTDTSGISVTPANRVPKKSLRGRILKGTPQYLGGDEK